MMQKKLLSVLWFVAVLWVACQETADSPSSPMPDTLSSVEIEGIPPLPTEGAAMLMVEFNKPFTLRVADTAVLGINQLTLTFLQVLEDSRCPTQVDCIQAGQARILLQISQTGETAETFELNSTPSPNAAQFTYQGYTIELLDLAPYPTDTGLDITTTPYQASLQVIPPNTALPPANPTS